MKPFSRVLYALLLALPLASCDSVTGKTDTPGGGGGDPIITPPASSAQLHASIASVSQHIQPGGGLTVTVVVSNLGPGTAKRSYGRSKPSWRSDEPVLCSGRDRLRCRC